MGRPKKVIKEILTTSEALKLALSKGIKLSIVTLHSYARKHKIGYQIEGNRGRWYFHKDKLEDLLDGKN